MRPGSHGLRPRSRFARYLATDTHAGHRSRVDNTPAPRSPAPQPGRIAEERERVVQRLSQAFAEDQLALDQLEARMAGVWRAESMEELRELLADLPAPLPAPVASATPAVRDAERLPSKTLMAMLGGVGRRGLWQVPHRLNAVAFMGGIELDLREADLSSGTTLITAIAIMGGIQVIVPPGVRVESDGLALLGGFEDTLEDTSTSRASPVLVRIRGLALMGGVEVKVLPRGIDPDA